MQEADTTGEWAAATIVTFLSVRETPKPIISTAPVAPSVLIFVGEAEVVDAEDSAIMARPPRPTSRRVAKLPQISPGDRRFRGLLVMAGEGKRERLSSNPAFSADFCWEKMVGDTGIEPVAPPV